ncbi:uncharacterized protein [Typha angustifolia]|uniref:uncharacterized protein n=1 Tax=Typha angustifolia TaxID=59011 RepID=UPI003C2C8638
MALPSTFQERLQRMEEARTQRLSLLQAEKDLQPRESHLLFSKLSNLLRVEQRCLLLERRHGDQARLPYPRQEVGDRRSRCQLPCRCSRIEVGYLTQSPKLVSEVRFLSLSLSTILTVWLQLVYLLE